MSHDNVIPFPGARRQPDSAPDLEVARRLVERLRAEGLTQAEIMARVWEEVPGVDPLDLLLRDPELLEPGPEPATYTLRLELDGATHPVWRRVAVPSTMTLDQLHDVIQRALGWEDYHLHRFEMGPGDLDPDVKPFVTEFDVSEGGSGILETGVRLDQVLGRVGDCLHYVYDFGDSWQHTIRLEQVGAYEDAAPLARCLDGERACPPEDIGGIGRFNETVARLLDPQAGEPDAHQRMVLDWLPPGWTPDRFDLVAADATLRREVQPLPPAVDWDSLSPELAGLAHRVDVTGRRALAALVRDADLAGPPATHEEQRAAMRPLLVLLDEVGADGAELTSAGYLRPASVHRIFTELGMDGHWIGKGNREDLTPPIALLREAAQALGLVRRYRGRLVATRAGRKVADDAAGLWRHVAGRLPAGSAPAMPDAGVVELLCVGAGTDPEEHRETVARLLAVVGWRTGDRREPDAEDARWLADPTRQVLDALRPDLRWGGPYPAPLRALARDALRRP